MLFGMVDENPFRSAARAICNSSTVTSFRLFLLMTISPTPNTVGRSK